MLLTMMAVAGPERSGSGPGVPVPSMTILVDGSGFIVVCMQSPVRWLLCSKSFLRLHAVSSGERRPSSALLSENSGVFSRLAGFREHANGFKPLHDRRFGGDRLDVSGNALAQIRRHPFRAEQAERGLD